MNALLSTAQRLCLSSQPLLTGSGGYPRFSSACLWLLHLKNPLALGAQAACPEAFLLLG